MKRKSNYLICGLLYLLLIFFSFMHPMVQRLNMDDFVMDALIFLTQTLLLFVALVIEFFLCKRERYKSAFILSLTKFILPFVWTGFWLAFSALDISYYLYLIPFTLSLLLCAVCEPLLIVREWKGAGGGQTDALRCTGQEPRARGRGNAGGKIPVRIIGFCVLMSVILVVFIVKAAGSSLKSAFLFIALPGGVFAALSAFQLLLVKKHLYPLSYVLILFKFLLLIPFIAAANVYTSLMQSDTFYISTAFSLILLIPAIAYLIIELNGLCREKMGAGTAKPTASVKAVV